MRSVVSSVHTTSSYTCESGVHENVEQTIFFKTLCCHLCHCFLYYSESFCAPLVYRGEMKLKFGSVPADIICILKGFKRQMDLFSPNVLIE